MKKPHVKWFGFRYVFPAIISLIAQTFSGTVQSVSVAQTVTADSIVSIVADAQELPLIPPEEVPLAGTFWTALPDPGGGIVPMPCPPYDPNAKIWIIAEGQFLADTTTNANNLNAAALEAQGEMAMNLITQIRTMGANRQSQAMGMDVPMPGDGGESSGGEGYPGFNSTYGVDTNQLWLEISNAFNGLVSVNLHQATNLVYAIWSTTNLLLPFSDWQVETEVWSPTNQTVAPFMVSTLDRPNLFLRAQDWTGVDSDSDGIPDWWIWKFFANFSLNATNLDSTGTNTLGYDYSHGLDPNVISFDLSISNLYVNTESVRLQIDLHGGVPSYQAVLINDTNLADAAWQAYAGTNLGLILGPTDGVYAVRVGLRGLPADAQQTWQELDLTLDRVPPAITITNPASGAISQPMIQLQGYVQDSLAQITYDLSNAAGVRTGQQGFMTGLGFDPSLFAFTTNFFQCFDIMLTNGVNAIALHATDLAGNTATTNLSLTLDYSADTTPPALTVIWPPEGALVSGDSFTFAGQVDDATAKVMVMTVDAGGNTNVEEGLVERDGMVWAANLPLAAGTNWLTVTAQDVAGNTASTNWAVVQSEVLVTIQPLASDQMNQSSVTVYGTVSDGTVKLYVNGVQAGVNVDTGAWRADYVPVNSSGTALLEVKIYPAAGGGGGGTLLVQGDDFLDDTEPIGSQRVKLTQPPVVQVVGYSKQRTTAGYYYVNIGESDYMETLSAINWVEGVGGWDHEHSWVTPHC